MYSDSACRCRCRSRHRAQVLVSKIAPAGAGWWGANIIASEYMGLAGTDVAYFATTALGDASAVWIGHCLFFFAKSTAMPGAGIEMKQEAQTASLLAGATLLSGFVWQPAGLDGPVLCGSGRHRHRVRPRILPRPPRVSRSV